MSVVIYSYDKCGTCRNALKWLKQSGVACEVVPIVDRPPTEAQLQEMIANSGKPLSKWFNTSGEVYRQLSLKDKLPSMTPEEQIRLLASNGKLLKRPIVSDGQQVTVGFNEAEFGDTWTVHHV